MTPKTITIHLIDTPGGGITVLTTAGQRIRGAEQSPAQLLADLALHALALRASDVRYWQGKDKALDLVQELIDPEGFGHSVTPEVRRRASQVLGRHAEHNTVEG